MAGNSLDGGGASRNGHRVHRWLQERAKLQPHLGSATHLGRHHKQQSSLGSNQLGENRAWEATSKANAEYWRYYSIPKMQTPLETELAKFLPDAELTQILATRSKATQILGLQSRAIKELLARQVIGVAQFVDMHRSIKDFLVHQGRCERIKDFPYPRQYASIDSFFIKLFCLLLPFGLLREFDSLNDTVEGVIKGHMVWLIIPFSVLISWMYTSLGRV